MLLSTRIVQEICVKKRDVEQFFRWRVGFCNLGDLKKSVYQTGHLKVFTIFELGMPQASESFWMGKKENVRKVPEFILGAPALVLMSTGRNKWADHS